MEAGGDPHNDSCLQAGQIGKYLPKVLEVGTLQLVLDEHLSTVLRDASDDVSLIWTDPYLCALKIEILDAQTGG